jgi:hypothetical protein
MPADRENARGVFARIMTAGDHRLVAGTLALVAQLASDEPHQRMEPEQRGDEVMDMRLEIVVPRDVFAFVGEHRVELRLRQPPEQRGRQQHHRTKHARHGRFDVGIRDVRVR